MKTIQITTQYKTRANSNVGQIVAKALGRQKARRYEQAESVEQNHRAAAEQALAKFLGPESVDYVLEESDQAKSMFPDGRGYTWTATRKS